MRPKNVSVNRRLEVTFRQLHRFQTVEELRREMELTANIIDQTKVFKILGLL